MLHPHFITSHHFQQKWHEGHIIIICFSFPRIPPQSPKVKSGRSLSSTPPPQTSKKEKKTPERILSLAPPAPSLSPSVSHLSPTKSPIKAEPEVKVEHGAIPKLVIQKKKCITKELHDGEECETCSDDKFDSDHYDK